MKSKKIISSLLAAALITGSVPGLVFADETEETDIIEDVEVEEEEEEAEEEEEEILIEELDEEEEEILVEDLDEEETEDEAQATSGTCGENAEWSYDTDTKTLTISGEGDMDGYRHQSTPWNDFRDEIENLVIEEGITNVSEYAFWDCEQLLSITLPDTLLSIDEDAFNMCESLVSISIPDSVTTIKGFTDCTSLKEVVFGENSELETIGGGAFLYCESLTTFTIPSSVTSIGYYAFQSCTSLQDIYCYADPDSLNWDDNDIDSYMPDKGTNVHVYSDDLGAYDVIFSGINVTFVGDLGLYCGRCGKNAEWNYDQDNRRLTIFGIGEMYGYPEHDNPWQDFISEIENLVIEEGITNVGENAFDHCENLKNVSLPDGLETIEDSAFYWCDSLTSVTIPDSVTSISGFDKCSSLETVIIGENSSLENIERGAFAGCGSLTSFTIPSSVTYIGNEAFYECSSLKDINCYADPNSLNWEDDSPDSYMPDGGTRVYVDGDMLDDYITKFYDINVTFVGEYPDIPCGEDAIASFDPGTGILTISGTGDMYDYDQSDNKAPWLERFTISEVVIEEGITNVGECAFADCRTLEYVTLPEGITSIEYLAFTGCYKLNSFELPTTLETIGDCAFQNCIGFTWVTIPESVTDINDSFFGCSNVTELYCYADPDELTWYDMTSNDFDRYNRINCHVPYEYLGKYQSKFAGVNVKFVVIPGWITQDGEKYYLQEDGSFYTGWLDFGDGVYYFFDEDGVMQTGWVQDKNYTYYMDEDGVMVTGWQKVDGKYYYFRESGPMKTGWLKDGGKFYYLDLSTGEMAKGWKKISEKWYYFNGGGDMVTGWKKISGKYYYFNDSGDMLTGWLSDGGKYYYLDPSTGAMATGWCKISDKWYYFNGGGDMVTGWKNISGKYYFFKASGAMKTGWFQDGDKKYYLDPSTGEMVTGWKKVSGKWYYFNAGGDMAKGWKKIGNKWYFFKDSGAMQTTNLTYKGKVYYFNSDGSCKNP